MASESNLVGKLVSTEVFNKETSRQLEVEALICAVLNDGRLLVRVGDELYLVEHAHVKLLT